MMARYLATVRLALADRTVEPGGPIELHELEPAAWAALARKGYLVEAGEELAVGEMAPVGTPGRMLAEGEWPADIERRLTTLPAGLRDGLADVSQDGQNT